MFWRGQMSPSLKSFNWYKCLRYSEIKALTRLADDLQETCYLDSVPGRNFFEIRRFFSKTAGNSSDTAVNLLRTADAPLS